MSITRIEDALLKPSGLTEQDIADTLSSIATRQIDYADIYFQSSWHESLVLDRITSYNVCYTKLLRFIRSSAKQRPGEN